MAEAQAARDFDVTHDARQAANDNARGRGHIAALAASYSPASDRLDSGLPTLNRALRGGLAMGKLLVISGSPGGGKTTLATCLLDRFERTGAASFYFAADEDGDGVLTRVAQLAGHSREAFENAGEHGQRERLRFQDQSLGRSWHVVDPDRQSDASEDGYCLEDFFRDAEAEAARLGKRCCATVDSIQVVACRAARHKDNARERVDAVLKVCKAASKRGVLVIMISEMSRDGYKHSNADDNADPLASCKESGSIEFGTSVLISVRPLSQDPKDVGKVWLVVAKARGGVGRPAFCCSIDAATASFTECGEQRAGAAKHDAGSKKMKGL
jgi:predicted ATP-dependent serine protease